MSLFIEYKSNPPVDTWFLQDIKGSSSTWINKKVFINGKFNWQVGYGAFSYSHSHIDRVIKYILNQEYHHKKKSFRDEYLELLTKFKIYKRYVLNDVN